MKKTILALGLLVPAMASQGFAAEGPVPTGIPHLDHVFVIVMENHAYGQIFNNPNTPFINAFAASANLVFCHRHSNPIVRNIYRRAVKHEVNMAERATH
jgi:hypothetical protein